MKKACVFVLIISLMSVNISGSFVKETKEITTMSFDGNTLYVGGTGPNNYTHIQDAINDAVDGDTVFVYDDSSPYDEQIFIDKPIALIGEDKETTIIDGSSFQSVIDILSNWVTITDFTIQNDASDPYWNFEINIRSNHVEISDNIIKNLEGNSPGFTVGINIEGEFVNVSNNTIFTNKFGINASGGKMIIQKNSFIDCYHYGIVFVEYCYDTIISQNYIENCIDGIGINSRLTNNTHIEDNTIVITNFDNMQYGASAIHMQGIDMIEPFDNYFINTVINNNSIDMLTSIDPDHQTYGISIFITDDITISGNQ